MERECIINAQWIVDTFYTKSESLMSFNSFVSLSNKGNASPRAFKVLRLVKKLKNIVFAMNMDLFMRYFFFFVFTQVFDIVIDGLKKIILKFFSYECYIFKIDRLAVFLIKLFHYEVFALYNEYFKFCYEFYSSNQAEQERDTFDGSEFESIKDEIAKHFQTRFE